MKAPDCVHDSGIEYTDLCSNCLRYERDKLRKTLEEHCIGKVHKCYYENQFTKMFKVMREIAGTPLGLDNHQDAIMFKGLAIKAIKGVADLS